ncbi:DUF1724 domain-containing protein [Methanolobus zinderi]|jgi:predicted transcriptional regulator|uniref:DUF1724 domain-containing protein n=1 Tax=Methanolobus zinderi TaxID=536044 RepID=A0A7D5EA11_9EURY|nr:transcriptional regulator FilR1 domain-containing protein [Methanolobus zinderi]QLC50495.1 DUF1724 domain-containing protein [Methanolobus zinderi]
MNDKSLETVITARNRNILLSLENGPKKSDELCTASGMDIMAFLSIIELLEKHKLITKEADFYRLTEMGQLVSDKLNPNLPIDKVVENVYDYWQNRNINFIPQQLLERLYEMDGLTEIQPRLSDIFDHNEEAHELFKSSKTFDMIAVSIRPYLSDLLREMIDSEVNLSIIFDPRLYNKLLVDEHEELIKLIGKSQIKLYKYPRDIDFVSLKLSESCMLLQSFTKEGAYDYTQLMSCSPVTVAWGKELFEYYLKDSTSITEIK